MRKPEFMLRPFRLSDAGSIAEQANNTGIWDNMRDGFPNPYTLEDGLKFIESLLEQPVPTRIFAIEIEGRAVGSVGIALRTDVERIDAEIGYWLGEPFWGRGIMTEAVKQTVRYAFANFDLMKIHATIFDYNRKSMAVLEKAGFALEAVLKNAAIKNGKVIDMHYYSIFREQVTL